MEKFARYFFSMPMMVVGLFVFLVAIAAATLVESSYDIQTAKILVYNALWFEILLAYMCINLIANIFTYRMFQREKIATLMFHLAFIIMIIGAGVTRFIGFEGMMMVREGETSDFIYSSDPYFWFSASEPKSEPQALATKMYLSEITDNSFSFELDNFKGRKSPITIEYVNFRKNLIDSLVVNDSIRTWSLEIVTNGRESNFVSQNGFIMIGENALSFDKSDAMPGILVTRKGAQLFIQSVLPMRTISMSTLRKSDQATGVADSLYANIPGDSLVPFTTSSLYVIGEEQFVFKEIIKNSKMMRLQSKRDDEGDDCLTVKVTDGEHSRIVDLNGGYGAIPQREFFRLNGVDYQMEYGSMKFQIPFKIRCNDFQLDKYPGSDQPSSFASEVTVIDEANGVNKNKRIFMNNVMDYEGYRFFQSGYDPDEGGTRLSVNHDWLGTLISYVGYLMMGIGMLLSLFAPNGRFRTLFRKLNKSIKNTTTVLVLVMLAGWSFGQDEHDHAHADQEHENGPTTVTVPSDPIYRMMSEAHSDKLASLLVQDQRGRIIPFHTMCDQMLRKIYRGTTYEDKNAVQVITSIHMYQGHWVNQPIIHVSAKSDLRKKLKMTGDAISYSDLTDKKTGEFILLADYNKAHQKFESKRNEFEKRLIQLGERYQLMAMIFNWQYMRMVPAATAPNNTWYVPLDPTLTQYDSTGFRLAMGYFGALDAASESGRFGQADDVLAELKDFQRKTAKNIVPDEAHVEMEISYNKMNIFNSVFKIYSLIGVLLMLVFFVRVLMNLKEKGVKIFRWIVLALSSVAVIGFFYHGYGIYMRWAISGHAPWSNGYEALVFIAFITVSVGLGFARKHMAILAGALILSCLMLYVSDMNLMDPEITPLQPVLKSYWLMIHVAVITGSYAPLGVACMLAMLNLMLYVLRTKKNGDRITRHINELTWLTEMSIMIGVMMLTIGTFLGGVWANESWGRYWGWDPKETWALVAVLAYAMVLHFRFIPGLKSTFAMNVGAFWAYTTILFTFFGVNFYLVGLHSYAQGDGLGRFPNWILIAAGIFLLFTVLAGWRNRQYSKLKSGE